jgi:hypothetical protein
VIRDSLRKRGPIQTETAVPLPLSFDLMVGVSSGILKGTRKSPTRNKHEIDSSSTLRNRRDRRHRCSYILNTCFELGEGDALAAAVHRSHITRAENHDVICNL